ncbi:MAG: 50S ribosomal protein L10 [Chloroflexota bacterium]|nr:50S ribosomal protein L10 [Chloroflexota bacterium]
MPTVKKAETIGSLSEKLKQNPLVILTEYRGMTVAEITNLRKQLRSKGAEYHVAKNTLLLRAANELGYSNLEEALSGPTAVAFIGEDLVGGVKSVLDYARTARADAKGAKVFVVKHGILQGQLIKGDQLEDLTKLPSKQELIGKLLGTLNAPAYGLVNVLAASPRNLVNVINAPIRDLANVLEQRRLQLEETAS